MYVCPQLKGNLVDCTSVGHVGQEGNDNCWLLQFSLSYDTKTYNQLNWKVDQQLCSDALSLSYRTYYWMTWHDPFRFFQLKLITSYKNRSKYTRRPLLLPSEIIEFNWYRFKSIFKRVMKISIRTPFCETKATKFLLGIHK